MVLSSLKSNALYDPIRSKWVSATPEEQIRQRLIRHMIDTLGYSPLWMAVEKELAQLPHLRLQPSAEVARRRVDIIIFNPHTLTPLLMLECKALPLIQAMAEQVIGYNLYVQAPFIALANGKEVLTGSYNPAQGDYSFQLGLPSFQTLI
jgi:hypothetical protein